MMDIFKAMKQVQELQGKMQALQTDLAQASVVGQSGGGLVAVTMNGRGEMRAVRIDPSLLKPGEAEMLEDLIVAAAADAKAKAESMAQEKMKEVTAGLPIPPGLSLPGFKL
jgi:hypothetical protein